MRFRRHFKLILDEFEIHTIETAEVVREVDESLADLDSEGNSIFHFSAAENSSEVHRFRKVCHVRTTSERGLDMFAYEGKKRTALLSVVLLLRSASPQHK